MPSEFSVVAVELLRSRHQLKNNGPTFAGGRPAVSASTSSGPGADSPLGSTFASFDDVLEAAKSYLSEEALRRRRPLFPGELIPVSEDPSLAHFIKAIRICDVFCPKEGAFAEKFPAPTPDTNASNSESQLPKRNLFVFYPFTLTNAEAEEETLRGGGNGTSGSQGGGSDSLFGGGGGGDGGGEGEGDGPCFEVMPFPHTSTEGLWESLIFDEPSNDATTTSAATLGETALVSSNAACGSEQAVAGSLKRTLLQYALTALRFSASGVNPLLVTCNRVVLFHGPPGTGKTSIVRALTHKLSIRCRSLGYKHTELVEVNAHSLFSRWFSESGKQVMQLFKRIQEMVEDRQVLVCVLIDEVESLAAARQSALGGNEPSDAIRVVNALLTQIDALRAHPNVLVFATSNITEAIDLAFLDRADMKLFIGPPSTAARRSILKSGIDELFRSKVLLPPPAASTTSETPSKSEPSSSIDEALTEFAHLTNGLTGRFLRKLHFLAFAECFGTGGSSGSGLANTDEGQATTSTVLPLLTLLGGATTTADLDAVQRTTGRLPTGSDTKGGKLSAAAKMAIGFDAFRRSLRVAILREQSSRANLSRVPPQ